jgi:hypothetical protein
MGMVCVTPWRLPAKRIVAPNSPRAPVQVRIAPLTRGMTQGTIPRAHLVFGLYHPAPGL